MKHRLKWIEFTVLFSDEETSKLNEELGIEIKSELEPCVLMLELNGLYGFNESTEKGKTILRTCSGSYVVDMEYSKVKQYILDETEHFNS